MFRYSKRQISLRFIRLLFINILCGTLPLPPSMQCLTFYSAGLLLRARLAVNCRPQPSTIPQPRVFHSILCTLQKKAPNFKSSLPLYASCAGSKRLAMPSSVARRASSRTLATSSRCKVDVVCVVSTHKKTHTAPRKHAEKKEKGLKKKAIAETAYKESNRRQSCTRPLNAPGHLEGLGHVVGHGVGRGGLPRHEAQGLVPRGVVVVPKLAPVAAAVRARLVAAVDAALEPVPAPAGSRRAAPEKNRDKRKFLPAKR